MGGASGSVRGRIRKLTMISTTTRNCCGSPRAEPWLRGIDVQVGQAAATGPRAELQQSGPRAELPPLG